MKQHYAVITLFPFLSYLAPESLSGPVCIISSQLTVYQKPPWAYSIMWFTVCDVLYSSCFTLMQPLVCVCRQALTEERREGERSLMALSWAYLINRLIKKNLAFHIWEERSCHLYGKRWQRSSWRDGSVGVFLQDSLELLWMIFFQRGGMSKWRDLLRSVEEKIRLSHSTEKRPYVDITFLGKNASINHMGKNLVNFILVYK